MMLYSAAFVHSDSVHISVVCRGRLTVVLETRSPVFRRCSVFLSGHFFC